MGVAPESMFGYLYPGIDASCTTQKSSAPAENMKSCEIFCSFKKYCVSRL
jgi:hypothetical protein